MRDYKRRRQSYRAKNVHITKKSYTEVRAPPVPLSVSRLAHRMGRVLTGCRAAHWRIVSRFLGTLPSSAARSSRPLPSWLGTPVSWPLSWGPWRPFPSQASVGGRVGAAETPL